MKNNTSRASGGCVSAKTLRNFNITNSVFIGNLAISEAGVFQLETIGYTNIINITAIENVAKKGGFLVGE